MQYLRIIILVVSIFVTGVLTQNCTFESDQCGWTQAQDDDFDWLRQRSNTGTPHTGPIGDHTIGAGGYFMYIENTFNGAPGDKARLISPDINLVANTPQCLTFWYHMHGAHINRLNVYIGDTGGLGNVIWTRQLTQGNVWKKGQLTLAAAANSTKNVVFEGIHGIIQGDIAIDDITVGDGACVPDYCNFEDDGNLCGGVQDTNDNIDWTLSSGSLGTAADYTFGTLSGHYLYVPANDQNRQQTARFISSTFTGSASAQCLQFYYIRSGQSASSTFSIYVQVGGNRGTPVWSSTASQGDGWFEGQVEINSASSFQIVFEAVRTTATAGFVGFDDFFVFPGQCSSVGVLPGSCDFESGLCSWKNVDTDDIDWVENKRGTGTGGTGPSNDHTKGNANGTYAYFEASNSEIGSIANFISAPYDANSQDDRCIDFWYHMYGTGIGTLKVQQVVGTQVTDLWVLSSNQGNSWINGRVGFSQDQGYQLMFSATRGSAPAGDICIDDVSILPGYCRAAYTPFDCDFEIDTCGWTQDDTDKMDWVRAKGYTTSPHTGPSQDHTIGVDGYYMYIENSVDKDFGDPARLNSPSVNIQANQPKCLTFWYHMYGAHIGSLNVYLKSGTTLGDAIWSRQTTYGDKWIQARVNIIQSATVTRTVVIEATQGYKIHGDIAIDDVLMQDGYCSFDMDGCDFENGLCGGMKDWSGDFNWTVSNGADGNGPSVDHTYECSVGNYLLMMATSDNANKVARFLTSIMSTTENRCLQFYYAWEGDEVAALGVQTKVGTAYSHSIWGRFLQLGSGWNVARVSLRRQTNFQVAFVVLRGSGDSGFVAVDDVVIMDGDCPNEDECNFEDGRCAWTNQVVGDDLDWVLNKGGTGTAHTGPETDHTTGGQSGTYLYLEGSNAASQASAKLYSQVFSPGLTHRCLEFWYSMYGSRMGTLQVGIITAADPDTTDTLWTLSGNQGQGWNYGRIPFISLKEYQLVFTGIRGTASQSDMGLDDIVISDGNCQGLPASATVHPPTVGPTSSANPCGPGKFTCTNGDCIDATQYCDFVAQCSDSSDEAQCPTDCIFNYNNDACGWYEGTPDDNFNWHVARGYDTQITPDLAPRTDHTYNSMYYYYAYIAPVGSYSYPYDTAEFMSPLFSSAAASCRLNFWWYQYGLRPYYFEVWLVTEDTEAKVFSYYSSMGDQWNNLIVGVGRQTKPWQIKLNKIRYSSYHAATAIDDTKFQNCGLPPPASFCDSSMFWCTNTRACISRDLLCDLQDDCGDYSDEMNCDSFTQCDFQSGTCDWTQASGTDHLTWNRRQGSTPTTYTGPIFDHTYTNSTGYYMYIEGYYNYYGKTAQLVSGIYRATTTRTCKLRMFYHMYGRNIGKLTIYTRIYYNSNQGQTVVWEQDGEVGPYWGKADATFYMTTDFQIVIEATAGDYYYGDIAIDDVTLTPDCLPRTSGGNLPNAPPTTPPPIPPSPTPHPSCSPTEFYCNADSRCIASELVCNFRSDCSDGEEEISKCMSSNCNFEDDSCGWLGVYVPSSRKRQAPEIPKFKWDRQQGNTRKPNDFRPPVDHTSGTGTGYYLFADNSPGQYRDTAVIRTPMIGQTGPNCQLEFYYHMGGTNVGSLQVLTLFGSDNSTKFSISGTQGDDWNKGQVFIGSGQNFQILIQATRGSTYYGDECLDDIKFVDCAPPVITGEDCETSEFRCGNTYCIDKAKVCNFVDDCMDYTDEDHCNTLAGRCDFELDFCSWKQELTDVFNWMLYKGGTASVGTGPDTDHTTRSEKGHYAYIETSYPRKQFDMARLASTTLKGTTSSTNCRIKLWYHMVGADIGSLAILIRTTYENDNLQVVKNITGEQGNFWYAMDELLDSGGQDFKVVIEGMSGNSYRGDIAIDDVTFTEQCLSGGSIPGEDDASKPPHDTCDDDPTKFQCDSGDTCFSGWQRCNFIEDCVDRTDESDCGTSCNFESGQCGWRNSVTDSFNWTMGQGPSWTTWTGPNTDHTLGNAQGHFLFLKSNTPYMYTGYKAHLLSLAYQHSSPNCKLEFWYHMYGRYMGSMSVKLKYGNHQSKNLWTLVGEQGNAWKKASVDIGQWEEFSLVIEAERGISIYSDMAIDDLKFINCGDSTYDRPCGVGTEFRCVADKRCVPIYQYCDYKKDCSDGSDEDKCIVKPGDCHCDDPTPSCDWEQYDDDEFDWSIGKKTPSNSSGAPVDHTTGNASSNSNFYFVDSTTQSESYMARIATPTYAMFPASKNLCTIRFFYHMYSKIDGMGTLKVYTESKTDNNQRLLMWHRSGNQGNQWNYANVVIGNPHDYKVVFEAIMGEKYASDIAIDDITFTASCANPDNSTQLPPGLCERNQFYCVGDNLCIPQSWVNDGNIDCPVDCYDEEQYRFQCELAAPQIGDSGPATNVGPIAGGVIGGLVAAALIILLIAFAVKKIRDKGGASFNMPSFTFGNKSDDKVRMSDVKEEFDSPLELPGGGLDPYSVDNPVYEGSVESFEPLPQPKIPASGPSESMA